MALKIVRNDITRMDTQAIVNTAGAQPAVGAGCDSAVYKAAGYDRLLAYRTENIGYVEEGGVFVTPGFDLKAEYIIHAVSPHYSDGNSGEEEKLRNCYKKSLDKAKELGVVSIAFPLIATGSFGYPKEEGMRIAADEINAFLLSNDMEIYLVVFDSTSTALGEKIYPDLEAYIDRNYVKEKREEEYGDAYYGSIRPGEEGYDEYRRSAYALNSRLMGSAAGSADKGRRLFGSLIGGGKAAKADSIPAEAEEVYEPQICAAPIYAASLPKETADEEADIDFVEEHESKLNERMKHLSDTYSEYLMYLIADKGMSNAEVYKRAIVDKKVFSKIKNNPEYHPQKLTALCLCIGAKLNMDESRDLLARAGYALSPCDKTDVIFSYFIENEIYDMIELDIQLEEHGQQCIIA